MMEPEVKAFLANALAHGLKTEVTEDLLDDYCLGLVDCINDLPLGICAEGDQDGILIELPESELIFMVWPKASITEFRIIGGFIDDNNKKDCEICLRIILTTVGWTLKFLPMLPVKPAGGLSVGETAETFSFKDDGFGIC